MDVPPAPFWTGSARTRSRPHEVATLYRAHFDYVWQVLRKLGVDAASAEDAAHDVFLVVHRRWDDFVGGPAVRTWLFAIARRIASRYRRTSYRSERRRAALAVALPAEPDTPDAALARKEAWRALLSFLEGLDEAHREVFILGEIRGVSRVQMGRVLGISPNTAYSRLRAARRQFTATFSEPANRRVVRQATTRPAPHAKQRVWALLLGEIGRASPIATWPAWSKGAGLVGLLGGGALFAILGSTPSPETLRDEPDPGPVVHAHSPEVSHAAVEAAAPMPLVLPEIASTKAHAPAASDAKRGTTRRAAGARMPRQTEASGNVELVESADRRLADIMPAMAKLADARRALRLGRSDLALELVERSRALDSSRAFATEQVVTRVWALCAADREVDARREARQLLERPASAAYVEVLSNSCVVDVINPGSSGEQPH